MATYQGRALQRGRATRRPRSWLARLGRVLGVLAVLVVLAHLPWRELRRRLIVVTEIRVEGTRYLDPQRVAEMARLRVGQDLLGVDFERARQRLLLHSRVARAEVGRRLPRGVRIRIVERVPVMLVNHGVPWELDSSGVLLDPLHTGVVADVPLLVGPSVSAAPAGAQVRSPEIDRGLAWNRALSGRELALAGQVSEVDVTSEDLTRLTLLDGTRVLAPAWPPPVRRLSALRVVLADLKQRGTEADEVDVRFENQVIVRPLPATEDAPNG